MLYPGSRGEPGRVGWTGEGALMMPVMVLCDDGGEGNEAGMSCGMPPRGGAFRGGCVARASQGL